MRPVFTWTSIVFSIAALLVSEWWGWRLAGLTAAQAAGADASQAPVAGYFLGLVLAVVPHELGHLVAALAVRLQVLGMAIGPFHVGSRPLPGTAGHVSINLSAVDLGDLGSGPDGRGETGRHIAGRLVVLSLAGPAGGLVAAAAAVLLAHQTAFSPEVRIGLASAGIAAGLFQIANLVPEAIGGVLLNDGAQAVLWMRHPAAQLDRMRLARSGPRASHGTGGAPRPGDGRDGTA